MKTTPEKNNSEFSLVRIFRQLENQHNFPNRFTVLLTLTVLNKHLLLKEV